jgi:hypothetical protein
MDSQFVHHSGAPLLAGSVRPSPQPLCLGFGHRLANAFVHQPSVASSTRCVLEGTSDSVACPLRFARPLVAVVSAQRLKTCLPSKSEKARSPSMPLALSLTFAFLRRTAEEGN